MTLAVEANKEEKVALVVGATGLVGIELVRILKRSPDWTVVYGLARIKPDVDGGGGGATGKYRFLSCDLLNRPETVETLRPVAGHVTHVFWVTWSSQLPLHSEECSDRNRSMLANVLHAITGGTSPSKLRHVSLQTGLDHYAYSSGTSVTYHDEESPRVDGGPPNFYYALEDHLKAEGPKIGGWTVHRPGLLLGSSSRSYFNIVGALCVYGTICRHLGLPFVFGGEPYCWEETYIDASDVRLVAGQQIWRSGSGDINGEAFNAVNVDEFAWKDVWPALASRFGLGMREGGGWLDKGFVYEREMGDKDGVWDEIVAKEGLRPTRLSELVNWCFIDAMFRGIGKLKVVRPTKAQRHGYTDTYTATESLLYWVDRMKEERLIP